MPSRTDLKPAVLAGTLYFTVVFAAAFVLGTLRVLVIIPVIGELWAVMLEGPIVLALSWAVCGWVLKKIPVRASLGVRAVMGVVAFALLMAAEIGVSVFAFGRTLAEHGASYLTAAAQAGLVAQVVFAAIPVIRVWTEPRARA